MTETIKLTVTHAQMHYMSVALLKRFYKKLDGEIRICLDYIKTIVYELGWSGWTSSISNENFKYIQDSLKFSYKNFIRNYVSLIICHMRQHGRSQKPLILGVSLI